ncbi:MAG: dual specificity protein phosphatase family protein [Oscillatoriales cyanobacterium C42_A2020_001]|nr:dual specificity protein phosphatase family protein [Leptolyngbyaceae cyanobacterium C42_A2020_001]
MYRFASASTNEAIVFGSAKPHRSDEGVNQWIEFMQSQSIQQVCCLLPPTQLANYSNLLATYQYAFGSERVCWAPIEDFCLADQAMLTQNILPFLANADEHHEKVVVHCSGGVGRTGHVLAAWLVSRRGFSPQDAIREVRSRSRNPYEAAIAGVFRGRNPWKAIAELNALLDACR